MVSSWISNFTKWCQGNSTTVVYIIAWEKIGVLNRTVLFTIQLLPALVSKLWVLQPQSVDAAMAGKPFTNYMLKFSSYYLIVFYMLVLSFSISNFSQYYWLCNALIFLVLLSIYIDQLYFSSCLNKKSTPKDVHFLTPAHSNIMVLLVVLPQSLFI